MRLSHASAVLAATSLTFGAIASGAVAQTTQGGSQGGVQGRDVNVSTYGAGQTTTNPDGSSIGIQGGGEATAADGGSASTSADAKLNERRAMQRSMATAQDDDERARSRTRTVVRQDGDVRSRTMTKYKADGERPINEQTYTINGVEQQRGKKGK
jgi:hypothetical protein